MATSTRVNEQEIIQNNTVEVPGWVLYTLLQHLEVSWDNTKLTIPQTEVTISSYRSGSRLLRELIDSKTKIPVETTSVVAENDLETIEEKPKKKRKPKK